MLQWDVASAGDAGVASAWDGSQAASVFRELPYAAPGCVLLNGQRGGADGTQVVLDVARRCVASTPFRSYWRLVATFRHAGWMATTLYLRRRGTAGAAAWQPSLWLPKSVRRRQRRRQRFRPPLYGSTQANSCNAAQSPSSTCARCRRVTQQPRTATPPAPAL